MTQKELENALTTLNWSNREAGNNLGITDRSLYNYLTGKRPVPLYIEKFAKLHLKVKRAISILT